MTPSSFGSAAVGAGADAYYPGDAYVDWLALDAYNWVGCAPGKPAAWRPLAQVAGPFRSFGLAHGKPLMLAEWGSAEDPLQPGRKAQWLRESMTTLVVVAGDSAPSPTSRRPAPAPGRWAPRPRRTAGVRGHRRTGRGPRPDVGAAASRASSTASRRCAVGFDGSASTGAGAASPAAASPSWTLDFGDGSAPATGTGASPSADRAHVRGRVAYRHASPCAPPTAARRRTSGGSPPRPARSSR